MIVVFVNVLNPAPHVALRNYLSADNFALNKFSKQILSTVFVCVCDVGSLVKKKKNVGGLIRKQREINQRQLILPEHQRRQLTGQSKKLSQM